MTLDEFIADNDGKPQSQRLSNVEIAERYGTSEASVRRHRRKLNHTNSFGLPDSPDDLNDPFFQVPVSAITSRGASIRTPDGSWQKISYSPAKAVLANTYSYQDLRDLFDKPQAPIHPTFHAPRTFVIALSDFQAGKVDEHGGSKELVKRVLNAYSQIEGYLENVQYEQIIIAETGDVLENFTNTTQQAQIDDLSLTDQIRLGQTLIAEGVRRFSHYAKDVVYVAVPSNHAAVRTSVGSKNRANAPDDDFGLLVQENIKAILEGREAYAHVRFVHPEKWEEACTVECADGTVLGVTHGHLAKSSDKVGEWFSKQAFAHRGGLDKADILLHGHFHSPSIRLSGDNHFVICAPTMDGGSSWFSNSAGEVSPAAILTFEAVNHIAQGWQLWYPEITDNKEEAK